MHWRHWRDLHSLRHFVLFIGYPRSGHTLVAALLDAHPRMVIANGLDAARYFEAGFSIGEVAMLSIWNSTRFTRHGRRSNGYGYAVPGGAHGTWERLEIVGDKSGDLFSSRLVSRPALAGLVAERVGRRARFLHVIRNPFDCIATMARRGGTSLKAAAGEFFSLCSANRRAQASVSPGAWIDVRLEALIADLSSELGRLCGDLGVSADRRYAECCAQLVFSAPKESRRAAAWQPSLVADIKARMRADPWFAGYDF